MLLHDDLKLIRQRECERILLYQHKSKQKSKDPTHSEHQQERCKSIHSKEGKKESNLDANI